MAQMASGRKSLVEPNRGSAPTARRSGLRRGSNLTHVADFNDSVVLDAIRRSGAGVSRAELTTGTGLAAQTVSDICQRLLDQGLIAETGTSSTGLGRPRRTLELVPGSRHALGLHIDPATITYVLLDLGGSLVAHASHETRVTTDPDRILAEMSRSLDDLVTRSGVDATSIVGLGIASPGPIDTEGGIVVDPPHLPGWHRVKLRDRLREATGLPVVLDKDVTAAAVAERWAGAAVGASDFALLYLGTGVGVGLVTDDIVVRGHSGNAGDIGHLIVDVDGPPCPCGQRGCLGVTVSPLTLAREAEAAGVLGASPDEDNWIGAIRRFALVCRAADDGDERALAILHRCARRLARAIATVADLTDANLFVVGGPAWEPAAHHYLPTLESQVSAQFVMRDIHDVRVVGTSLGADVGALGAASLVLDGTFAARPSALLLG
jgi:predicted NBD/HSP70 family sugar kinase